MYTLEKAKEHWETTGKHGSKEERIARGRLWQPYYSYLAKQQMDTPYRGNPHAERTVTYLLQQGVLNKDDRVLDIGAGTGSYDLEFARHCARVLAMDSNEDSLRVLQQRADKLSLSNIETLCTTWEEYDSQDTFHITFSAMCPAICNQEEIERMESVTSRTCCIIAVMRGSYEKHRMAMMKGLPIIRNGGMTTEALTYYNNLYLMGRHPNVKCWSDTFTTRRPVEEVLEQYRQYFPIFGVEDAVTKAFLQEYLAKEAPDGILQDECHMNYALIYWNVPGK